VGVAVARGGVPLDELRSQAESRLAEAKQAGGNRVVGLPAR
jgi:PleD family two-component response regulator